VTGSTIRWVPFFFDGNSGFGEINSIERWQWLIEQYLKSEPDQGVWKGAREHIVNQLLQASMAPVEEVSQLPPSYFIPSDIPSFGWRREHTSIITLEMWAQTVGVNLRDAAKVSG